MEDLIADAWNLIIFLVEIAVILIIIDGIFCILGSIFGFSWKKVLMSAAAVFGILWLRDFLHKRKEKAKEEVIQELTEEDFETVE